MSEGEPLARWRASLADPSTRGSALRAAPATAESLLRSGSRHDALSVTEEALAQATGPDIVLGLRNVRALALLQGGETPDDLHEIVRLLLARADEWWAQAESRRGADAEAPARAAARWLWSALWLLLHRQRHTGSTVSPLAADPAGELADLRRSAVYRALHSPSRSAHVRSVKSGGTAALVSTGSAFLAPVVDAAVAAGLHVEQVLLSEAVDPVPPLAHLLAERLVRVAVGGPAGIPALTAELPPALARADVVFVDWVDVAAVWASLRFPRPTWRRRAPRLVVRLHSVEAVSVAVHIVDWSRVDSVVYVSDFLRRFTEAVVPAIASVPSVVIGLSVEGPVRRSMKPASAWSTLGMVGWGQAVKDPRFAVEILARLRVRDPDRDWRLRLVGVDLDAGAREWDADYVAAFEQESAQEAVAGAVERLGFHDDVSVPLTDIGFILSTSVRESTHLGLVEGALSGCVPVVRDWPMVAPWGGARELYPLDWIVGSVDEAVDRILSIDDPQTVGAQASEWAAAAFAPAQWHSAYRQVLRG